MKNINNLQKVIIFAIPVIFILISCNQPGNKDFNMNAISTVKNLPEGHKNFIATFHPDIADANRKIILERAELINLRDDFHYVIKKKRRLRWLNEIASKYKFGDNFFTNNLTRQTYKQKIDTLLFRVDYIPEKLILAQAVIESGWGSSKFAIEDNNYFGIHCYTKGCGPAATDVENPKFWVKSFPSLHSCIQEYLSLLNTGYAYEGLRQTRLELRRKKLYPDALLLANGLEKYSEKGSEYIELIHSVIKNYLPDDIDEFVRYQNSLSKKRMIKQTV